ncbi:MAG TPA: LLM class F420-dependent oxidoreductase, partial [Lentzea sp.]
IGGKGAKRTPALAASYATEFNLPFVGIDDAVAQYARVDAACAEIGRDASEIIRSVALVACVGRTDADVARRAAAIGREVAELKQNGLCGTPAEVVERIGTWREATGVQRVYLQVLDLADLDHITEIAADVAPQLG